MFGLLLFDVNYKCVVFVFNVILNEILYYEVGFKVDFVGVDFELYSFVGGVIADVVAMRSVFIEGVFMIFLYMWIVFV